jgi:predicted NBD/HSP70 family sugar kinase
MERWRDVDLVAALEDRCQLPVFCQNDGTAACGAELIFGRGLDDRDFVYFFIGSFIGGGVVLNNAVYVGRSGNAGALGSMPMSTVGERASQLIDEASIFVLENQLRAAGMDPSPLWLDPEDWEGFGALLDRWIDHTAQSLAHAIVASCSVIDFPLAVIDGGMPAHVRRAIVRTTEKAVNRLDLQGIAPPRIIEGSVGANARVIGAASLPFFARYLVDQNMLFKEDA